MFCIFNAPLLTKSTNHKIIKWGQTSRLLAKMGALKQNRGQHFKHSCLAVLVRSLSVNLTLQVWKSGRLDFGRLDCWVVGNLDYWTLDC